MQPELMLDPMWHQHSLPAMAARGWKEKETRESESKLHERTT